MCFLLLHVDFVKIWDCCSRNFRHFSFFILEATNKMAEFLTCLLGARWIAWWKWSIERLKMSKNESIWKKLSQQGQAMQMLSSKWFLCLENQDGWRWDSADAEYSFPAARVFSCLERVHWKVTSKLSTNQRFQKWHLSLMPKHLCKDAAWPWESCLGRSNEQIWFCLVWCSTLWSTCQ